MRFPIECEVRYRLMDSRKHLPQQIGKTIDMSSKGVFFDAGCSLPVGKRIEMSISWPALLNEKCRLKFVAIGRVVRAEDGKAAALVQTHEFRTQGALAIA